MAGFILTSGSHFTPFSYDELVKPIQQFTDAQNAAAKDYGDILADSSALQNYIDSEKDVEARKIYDNYMTKLQTLQDNLWSKGYNAGTVRDLAAARAGYTGDITRLAKAIESRQARSKEYWEARHKNPDLITGYDPSLSSLDSYLKDDNYGQDWYSYSGTELAKETAADISARANELLRDPRIMNNPQIAGYITRVMQKGFTNGEINRAGDAAWAYLNGNASALNNLDSISRIAADVLVNRMQSTGAGIGSEGNVSPEEYKRMFGYAMMGMSSGVQAPDIKDFDDKEWELQKQLTIAAAKNPSGDGISTEDGYNVDAVISQIRTEGAAKANVKMDSVFENPFQHDGNGNRIPVNIKLPDGRSIPVDSVEAITDLVYNTPERQFIKEHFGGLDLGLKPYNGTSDSRQKAVIAVNGKTAAFETGKLKSKDAERLGLTNDHPVAILQMVNGKPVLNEDFTKLYNEKLAAHQKYVDEVLKLNNKTLKMEKLTLDPEESKKLAEKYELPTNLPPADIKAAVFAKESVSHRSPAVLVDASESMGSIRKDYLNNIFTTYSQSKAYNGGKEDKSSTANWAFYPIADGGNSFKAKGTTKLSDVFTLSSDGVPKSDSLLDVSVYPQDLAKGMVRITTDKGVFGVSANSLGGITANTLNNPEFQDIVAKVMTPFTTPGIVLSDAQADEQLTLFMYQALQQFAPIKGNGEPIYMSEIVRNPDYQTLLYDGITRFMNTVIANPREIKGQHHFQHTGNSSTKPQQFNSSIR